MNDPPILVTGATGFLGGFLSGELLARGRRTILLTGPGGDPHARVAKLLDYLGVTPLQPPRVMSADITRPDLGLNADCLKELTNVREVLHCAAVTSFSKGKAELLRRVNLQGTVNVLDAVPRCDHFHHMSTAYTAGKSSGRCMETEVIRNEFNNPYEETKKLAEDTLTSLCRERNIPLAIFRPSITYGESTTGRSIRFNALYYPVKVLLFMRDTMLRDIRENGGSRASDLGVSLGRDGRVSLPLTLPGGGSLNLVPVDFLVKSVLAVMESKGTGVYHVTNPQSNSVEELVSYIARFYGITGIGVSSGIEEHGVLQSLINRYMRVYYPYFCDGRTFDATRLQGVLKNTLHCPVMDAAMFKRCMDYACDKNWGKELSI